MLDDIVQKIASKNLSSEDIKYLENAIDIYNIENALEKLNADRGTYAITYTHITYLHFRNFANDNIQLSALDYNGSCISSDMFKILEKNKEPLYAVFTERTNDTIRVSLYTAAMLRKKYNLTDIQVSTMFRKATCTIEYYSERSPHAHLIGKIICNYLPSNPYGSNKLQIMSALEHYIYSNNF